MPAVCDCFPELKSVTAAREACYRSDPGKAAPEGPQSSLEIKVTSIGNLNERVETRNSGRHFIISEPKQIMLVIIEVPPWLMNGSGMPTTGASPSTIEMLIAT